MLTESQPAYPFTNLPSMNLFPMTMLCCVTNAIRPMFLWMRCLCCLSLSLCVLKYFQSVSTHPEMNSPFMRYTREAMILYSKWLWAMPLCLMDWHPSVWDPLTRINHVSRALLTATSFSDETHVCFPYVCKWLVATILLCPYGIVWLVWALSYDKWCCWTKLWNKWWNSSDNPNIRSTTMQRKYLSRKPEALTWISKPNTGDPLLRLEGLWIMFHISSWLLSFLPWRIFCQRTDWKLNQWGSDCLLQRLCRRKCVRFVYRGWGFASEWKR